MGDVVTIRDVARLAQVSVATVSRALNGQQNVASTVRERVLDAARELKYVPHHAARSLSSRRTRTIGVVLPDLHGEFFSELMRGIDVVAREHDLHLLVSSYHGHPDEQGTALRAMRGRVDGLLVLSPFVDSQALASELGQSQPAVLINSHLTGVGLGTLRIDNYGGARAMVAHLVDNGFRRIAFVTGPNDNFDADERLRGYTDALAELLPDAQPIVLQGAFDESSGHAAGHDVLEDGPAPRRGVRRQRHDRARRAVRLPPGGPHRAGRHRRRRLRRHSARALRASLADDDLRRHRRTRRPRAAHAARRPRKPDTAHAGSDAHRAAPGRAANPPNAAAPRIAATVPEIALPQRVALFFEMFSNPNRRTTHHRERTP